MRILLSNDDGVLAPGLAALYAAVADMGQVTVVAPASPQSASGHSITLRQALVTQKMHIEGPRPFAATSVDGRPADCVRLAIRKLMDSPPDLVLSGINAGSNLGINVLYSGTVAAAAEGAMLCIPSVAFSASLAGDAMDFSRVAYWCRWTLDQLLEHGLRGGDLMNVNIPPLTAGRPLGVRLVTQSVAELDDNYMLEVDASGRNTYRLSDTYGFRHGQIHADVPSLADGYITITPLHVDMTSHSRLAELSKRFWAEIPRR